ncbi:hypothetical protein [Arcticibacter sp.]|jgi:hypothetical protein|uniref:hypothetical protein n=1 Tax=Arcticibacter sp. TaxID=1872630 RepID=UPI00388D2FC4
MRAETTSPAGTGSNIQGLYLSSRNWLSYIDFFEDEVKFLKKLMLKFFGDELNDDRINKIQLINCSINSLDRKKNAVLSKIFCHQANLKATIEELMNLSEDYLTVQHESIQQDVMALQTTLDEIKAELYSTTETQIKQSRWVSSMTG